VGKSFLDLIVWQRAVDMTASVYELTDSFPRKEIYGLTSQLRRAAVSVASNIAEGAGRGSKKEFRQFLNVARGSNSRFRLSLLMLRV
jgi:four helix bundle protein